MSVKIVKSASRIFEILELFNKTRQPMPAIDIANALGYPLASTHELLKTMEALGYFTFGDPKWTYKPSNKLPKMVDWVRDSIIDDRRIHLFLSDLNEATKETINLSRQLPREIKIIKGLECIYQIGVSSKAGTIMSVTKSLTGMASLAALSDMALMDYFSALKRSDPEQYLKMDRKKIKDIRETVISQGTVMRCDFVVQGIGAVCIPIVMPGLHQIIVVGIVGPSDRIQMHEVAHQKAIRRLVKEHSIPTCYKIKRLKRAK